MKKRQTILILDDEENIIQALGKEVQKQGHAVVVCLHPQEALHRITKTPVQPRYLGFEDAGHARH